MIIQERGNPAADDPRLSHDDPLLDGLLILCRLHGCSVSRTSLSVLPAGLFADLPQLATLYA